MKVNRLFLVLMLISSWSGCVLAGDEAEDNVVKSFFKERGFDVDTDRFVFRNPLDKLKVDLALNPSIQSFLASDFMNNLQKRRRELKEQEFSKKYLENIKKIKNSSANVLESNDQVIQKAEECIEALYGWRNSITDEKEIAEIDKKILETLEGSAQVMQRIDELYKQGNIELRDPVLLEKLKTLEKNMGQQEKKLSFCVHEDEGSGAYINALGELNLNPQFFSRIKNSEDAVSLNEEHALAHEMSHSKYNAHAEQVLGQAVGGVAGASLPLAFARYAKSKPRLYALGAAMAALPYATSKFAKKYVDKHVEAIADVGGLRYALPIYNARDDKKYDEALKIALFQGAARNSELEKKGYLDAPQFFYAAQRMYKPELHKPYGTDNNPGQFLAEQGGV